MLLWLLRKIGAQPPFTGPLGWAVLTVALVGIGLFFCRLWRIDKLPVISTAAILIFVLHPYQTEIFTFHTVTLVTGIALASAVVSLAYSDRYGRKWYLSVVLLGFSLGIYQLALNYVFLALLLAIPFYVDAAPAERNRFISTLKWRFGAMFAGCALYEISLQIVAHTLHRAAISRSPDGRLRLNERDEAQANRIVTRLEMLPNFKSLRGIAIDGGLSGYPVPVTTDIHDMNVSAFSKSWSKLPLLIEASGYDFQPAPPSIQAAAAAYCSEVPKWPASQSVSTIESYGVVCLPK